MTLQSKLDEIKSRCLKASDGPWGVKDSRIVTDKIVSGKDALFCGYENTKSDSVFVAHADDLRNGLATYIEDYKKMNKIKTQEEG